MEIVGKLSGIEVFGGWARANLVDEEGESRKAVGAALIGLSEERLYRFSGVWSEHARFGWQMEIKLAQLTVPLDKNFLESELQRLFNGCGSKTARQLLTEFESRHVSRGAGSWMSAMLDLIDRRPWELQSVSNKLQYIGALSLTPAARFHRSLQARVATPLPEQVIARLHSFLSKDVEDERGIELTLIAKLAAAPYAPCQSLESYTFPIADAVAFALGVPQDSPQRQAYLAFEAVRSFCLRYGHTFITSEQFAKALSRIDPAAKASACVNEALKQGLPLQVDPGIGIYLSNVKQAEQSVARAFAQMCEDSEPLWTGERDELESGLAAAEQSMGVTLDPSQRAAVIGLMTSSRRLHTLTAGPGCGKTLVMEAVAALLGAQTNFAAPTGKAAKVLSRRVDKYGTVATTVHALLGANGEGYALDALTPLQGSLIVVDEAGMQDLEVCAALVDAIPPRMHLLLVGDLDQLDSVGQGSVLADAVQITEADHHRLTTPYRSGLGILKFLQGLREGKIEHEAQDSSVAVHTPNADAAQCFEDISQEWLTAVAEHGLESVALLFGHRKGDPSTPGLNVTFANAALQDLINPASEANAVPGTTLRIEDRILIRRNLSLKYRLDDGRMETYAQLVNGDSGYLVGFSGSSTGLESLHLRMDDGRDVALPAAFASRVELGYAQTVHSSQGSEFTQVILFLSGKGGEFLNRRLLYTGASRARDRLLLVASRNDLTSIAAHQSPPRQSGLLTRIAQVSGAPATAVEANADESVAAAPSGESAPSAEPSPGPLPAPRTAHAAPPTALSQPSTPPVSAPRHQRVDAATEVKPPW